MEKQKPRIDFKRMNKLNKFEVSRRWRACFNGPKGVSKTAHDIYLVGFKEGIQWQKTKTLK